MRLEFIPGPALDCPLIRLDDFNSDEVERLVAAANQLAAKSVGRLSIEETVGVNAVDGCALTLCLGTRDRGIIQVAPNQFECWMTPEGWEDVACRAASIAADATGYQWLLDVASDVNWLLSLNGRW